MGKKRSKIYDPAEVARKRADDQAKASVERQRVRGDPGSWGPNDDTLTAGDVSDTPADRSKVRRIQRFDCFALMVARCEGDAEREELKTANRYVRRYQDDIATLHRAAGVAGDGVVVDFGRTGKEFANIAAGERLRAVEPLMGAQSSALMRRLAETAITTTGQGWRAIVESVTGERNNNAQGALIRAAMHNAMAAYQQIDTAARRVG